MRVARVYVTGHRNPDTDSIASAIGYAELKRRLDPGNEYVPVRLGELNAQTRWVLEQADVPEPPLLEHVLLRVRDVMRSEFPLARDGEPVREVGLIIAHGDVDLVPIVDDSGALAGVMTERALARRYVRESREASRLDAPTAVGAIADVLEGDQLVGKAEHEVGGRVWVLAMATASLPLGFTAGDVVVVGDRPDAQRIAIETGVALLVTSNGTQPGDDILALARDEGTAIVSSPLDSYVTSRMITLSAPCRALMDTDPLVVGPDDLLADISDTVKEIDYRAAVVVDGSRKPIGLVTRGDLVSPQPRRVLLVDHAEQAQSVVGVEHAEIVEILDHHHIGSIETRVPVRATFDPVGSTATLVIERFRQNGMEPSKPVATLLLGAILSDTVILNSPTTTERDHNVVGLPRAGAGGRPDRVRPRHVRAHVRPRARAGRPDRQARRQGLRRRRPHAADRPGRDGRPGPRRAPRRAARGARRRAREGGARARRADGHRHHGQGLPAVRVRRAAGRRPRVRPRPQRRRAA